MVVVEVRRIQSDNDPNCVPVRSDSLGQKEKGKKNNLGLQLKNGVSTAFLPVTIILSIQLYPCQERPVRPLVLNNAQRKPGLDFVTTSMQ